MAIAWVQEFEGDPSDRSTTNYDAVKARLNVDADNPAGLIAHTAGFVGDGVFRIFDVWETEDDRKRFEDERLMPVIKQLMDEGGFGAPPVREYTYELHDVITG
jgi:hypothetical protein